MLIFFRKIYEFDSSYVCCICDSMDEGDDANMIDGDE